MRSDRTLGVQYGGTTATVLAHLLTMSDDAILVRDPDGKIEVWNHGAALLYGYSAEEACGRISHDLLQTRFPRPLREIEAEVREKGGWRGELVHKTKGGEEKMVSARFQLIHGEDGVDRLLETNRDITARKQMEEELRQAHRGKDAFLSMLSHELRNPLTPIRNSLAILGWATPGGEQAGRALSIIRRQVDLLVHIVEDLLDVTRINAGRVHLQRTRLDLVEVLRRTVEDYRGLLEPREVAVELPRDAVWVDGDASRLAQAIGNLLSNAAKFTPEDGKISLSLAARDGHAVLEVADTGQGIDHETLKHIFEPFVQADQPIHRSAGGLGLGLAVVRGMIRLHGGEVTAHSRGPGCGARFSIELPLLARREDLAQVPEPPHAPTDAPPIKVLVVEDNRDAADGLRDLLEFDGYRVAVAFDGAEGLATAREFHPDVTLCDIGLPGMDGYSVARAFRQDASLASGYLVALTGYTQPESQRMVREAGFDAFLAKPPDYAALARILANRHCST